MGPQAVFVGFLSQGALGALPVEECILERKEQDAVWPEHEKTSSHCHGKEKPSMRHYEPVHTEKESHKMLESRMTDNDWWQEFHQLTISNDKMVKTTSGFPAKQHLMHAAVMAERCEIANQRKINAAMHVMPWQFRKKRTVRQFRHEVSMVCPGNMPIFVATLTPLAPTVFQTAGMKCISGCKVWTWASWHIQKLGPHFKRPSSFLLLLFDCFKINRQC